MKLSEDQIQEIEKFSACFFTPAEVAVIIGLKEDWANSQMIEDTEFKTAYNRGQLICEAEVRKSIFDMAKSGSAPAQVLAVNIMKDAELKRIDV